MWIFTSDAFCSLVEHWKKPNHLVAQARFAGHLERLFPGAKVRVTPGNDYRFRCIVTKQRAADVYAAAIMNIGYGNFKNSITDPRLHDAAASVWAVMFRAQDDAALERRATGRASVLRVRRMKRAKPYAQPRVWWWLSFANDGGYAGVAIVRSENTLVHALNEARERGCNPPDTSVAAFVMAGASPDPAYVNRLLSREEAEFADAAIAAARRANLG